MPNDLDQLDPSVAAIEAVMSLNPELFCARGGQPLIVIPGRTPFPLSIYSAQVQEWIALLYWRKQRRVLRKSCLRRIVTLLAGMAGENQRDGHVDFGLGHTVDREPCLWSVVEFMASHDGDRFECRSSDFYRKLSDFAEKTGTIKSCRSWPRGAGALTALLNRHASTLRELGIEFKNEHERFGSQITILRITPEHPADDHHAASVARQHTGSEDNPSLGVEADVELIQHLQKMKEMDA